MTNGRWIRPIGKSATGELVDQRYSDHSYPRLLDVIRIPLLSHQPQGCQWENYLVSEKDDWQKEGQFKWSDLERFTDPIKGDLWINGHSSYNGINDRIPAETANTLPNSLALIQPAEIVITVTSEGRYYPKRKVRARFSFNEKLYKLAVTDPQIEQNFLQKENGTYRLNANTLYLCLSIGSPYENYCYKLIASIILQAAITFCYE